MARISGVNIPSGKRIEVALTYVYGIGATRAKQICKDASLDANKRVNSLSEDELSKIRDIVEKKYTVEGDLRREITVNLKKTYRPWLLQRFETQKGFACKRAENQYQC